MRFTRFGVGLRNNVNCDTLAPQRKHEKTLRCYTDYELFCFFKQVFNMFSSLLFNGKPYEFRPHEKACKLQ